jgi:hypothetical protein
MTTSLGLALAALLAAGPTSQPVRSQPDTTSAHLATDIRSIDWTDSGQPHVAGQTAHAYRIAPGTATVAVQDTTRPRRGAARRMPPPPEPERTGAGNAPRRPGGRAPEGVAPDRARDRPKGQPRSTGEPVLKRRKP